tara:strand:+ start:1797 stop:2141 length:345 start_codon:yes stop_codon:yes gene_type:complete
MNINIYINEKEISIKKRSEKEIFAKKRNTEFKNSLKTLNLNSSLDCNPLNLSVRTTECLKQANIFTFNKLISFTPNQLLKVKNFGRKSLTEIQDYLAFFGLNLAKDYITGEINE